MATRDAVLGLFAKHPLPGQVKTRLAAATSPEWAARVAEAFLRDTVQRLSALEVERVLAFTPPDARPYFARLVRGRFTLQPQVEGDLGQRMASFFADKFRQDKRRVILVGTDSPTLPLELIERAFEDLEHADIVLGPATDGGYYLIGCAGRLPSIFEGLAWGGSQVLAETVARLADGVWRLALLPPWYDVDTLDDWQMLVGHLAAMQRAGIDAGVREIQALIAKAHSGC